MNEILYSNSDNASKTEAYSALLTEVENTKRIATQNENQYILSQLRKLSVIDKYTIPVAKEMCVRFVERYNTYYDINADSDVLVSDLDHARLGIITYDFFDCEYLSQVSEIRRDPWVGISYGPQGRALFCLPLSRGDQPAIWCTFLFNTGSKLNYVSSQTYERLGLDLMGASSRMKVKVNGIYTWVYSGEHDPRLKGINILGVDFLASFDCTLSLKYKDGKCTPTITNDTVTSTNMST